jgi:hypothetical protein
LLETPPPPPAMTRYSTAKFSGMAKPMFPVPAVNVVTKSDPTVAVVDVSPAPPVIPKVFG